MNYQDQSRSEWEPSRHVAVVEALVNYHNEKRAPLLFIAGGEDNIMPPSVNKSNAHHYTSKVVTDYHEFPGRCYFTCGQEGWEAVADYALDWAEKAQTT